MVRYFFLFTGGGGRGDDYRISVAQLYIINYISHLYAKYISCICDLFESLSLIPWGVRE